MRKLLRFLFWTALVIGGLIGLLRLTAIRWWRVPEDDPYLSASVSPSIRAGDWILLWRLTKPGFGDLVMCPEPKHPERVVIGRIAAESRDDIKVNGADITLNRKRQIVERNCDDGVFQEHNPDNGIEIEQHCSMEDLSGSLHMRGEIPNSSVRPSDVDTTVPDGTVWLVSDNRLFPYDSREFGPVPRDTCRETVFFRLISAAGYFDVKNRNTFIQ